MLNVKYLLVQQNNEQNQIKNPNVLGCRLGGRFTSGCSYGRWCTGVNEKHGFFQPEAVVLKSELPDNLPVKYDAQKMDKIELINNHPTKSQIRI